MIQTIDNLETEIRRVIPQADQIKQFTKDTAGRYITFHWNGHNFVVQLNLNTFELRNQKLLVTGASSLIHAALSGKMKNYRIIEAWIDLLRQAEGMLEGTQQLEDGLRLLATVKSSMIRIGRISSDKIDKSAD